MSAFFFTFIKENVKIFIILKFVDPSFSSCCFLKGNESLTSNEKKTDINIFNGFRNKIVEK